MSIGMIIFFAAIIFAIINQDMGEKKMDKPKREYRVSKFELIMIYFAFGFSTLTFLMIYMKYFN